MNIKVINRSKNALPAYETIHAAGMDLRADLEARYGLNRLSVS
jgi:dUTP pyrophosphatase